MLKRLSTIITLIVIFSMLTPPLQALGQVIDASIPKDYGETGIYRTSVTLQHPKDRERLDGFGVQVLAAWEGGARVLATQEQLETLARQGFEPRGSAELGALVAANALNKAWMVESFDPFFQSVGSATTIMADGETAVDANVFSSLTGEQLAAINAVKTAQGGESKA